MRSTKVLRKFTVISVMSGSALAALGPCTTNDLQTQLAGGMRTAINGMLNIVVTQFTNDLWGVNR